MKKEKKAKDFLPTPEYPGGNKAMANFIGQNLKYPKNAFDQKIEGTVIIKGEINFEGKVIQTKVLSSLHSECDAEAQRVVSLLQFQVEKIRNAKVIYYKTFHIHFKLPATPPPMQVNYVVTPKESEKLIQYTVVIGKGVEKAEG
ncbi:MAG: TonB family protein [Saprospiraceae bacterium]|nr:TonB family protein [Saprospiraceae bacterium]